jgi:hypothetical protein
MGVFQALRRSIKGEKDKPQIAIAPKSAVAIVPPKKVRRLGLTPLPSHVSGVFSICSPLGTAQFRSYRADNESTPRSFERSMITKRDQAKN